MQQDNIRRNNMKMKYIKRKIVIFIFAIFIFSTITPIINGNILTTLENYKTINQQYRGDTFYVGGSGPNNYSTIQSAVNAAQTDDMIFVYSGIYTEHVLIEKTLILKGENKDSVIIDGSFNGNCIKITADSVVIDGFTIRKGLIGPGLYFETISSYFI